ncbi:MAG: hypothetical protein OEZ25_05490 [Candidatus Bathyarchaeota archaeon]|nr:hypothetical protein [Candidatus Bathyarchaeota archaeon]
MKKLTRLGTIILLLGVSFATLAIVRGGNTYSRIEFFPNICPNMGCTPEFFAFPRDLKLNIEAPVGVNIKLSDPSGEVLLDVKNATGSYTTHLSKRGTHTLTIFNPSNSSISVQVNYTFHNLEEDLIQTSTILIISGAIIIITKHSYFKIKQKSHNHTQLSENAHLQK